MGENRLFNYHIAEKKMFKSGICEEATYYYRKIKGEDSINKKLDKSATLFFKIFLAIIKKLDKNTNNYVDAYKLLKGNANLFIGQFIKSKK